MKARLALFVAAWLAMPDLAHAEDPDRVIMKLDDFLTMHDTVQKKDDEAPRDATISSARYRGEVVVEEGKPLSATFTARMHVEVLRKKGWARLPLLPATVALQSAKIGGRDAAVVIEDEYYTLVTDRRGAFELDLEFAASVTTAQGRSVVAFDLAGSGATTVELAVPADADLDFAVANARLQSDSVVGKNRVVKATLPSTGSLSISWQNKIPEAAKQTARVYSEIYSLVGVGDGVMRLNATINNTILFAGVERLRYRMPEGMTLLEVSGAGIRDWKLDGTTLDIVLNYAAEGAYTLQLSLEKVVGEKSQNVVAPIIEPVDVERAKGWLGVEARGNLEIGAGKIQQATAVDVRSLPAAILGITDQPVLLGYKYLGTDPKIPLEILHHDDVDVLVTLLDQTRARTMWTRQGRRLTSVKYQIRNNRRQFLRLALAEGAELWSASVGGRAVQPARAKDGRVMIPLLRSQAAGGALAAFEVEVVYVESGPAASDWGRGTFEAALPRPDAPSTYVAWTIYSPDHAKVKKRTIDGTLRRVDDLSNPIPTEDLYAIQTELPNVEAASKAQIDHGGLGSGALPVPVSLPLQGRAVFFEKLLALDEDLAIKFDYRGLRK